MADQKTLLAIGAHFDDCAYGVPGIMLKAVAKNYRVVQLILIGDYSNWPPTKGREDIFRKSVISIAQDFGVETRFLDFASHQFDTNEHTKQKVAAAVHELKPDIALQLWEHDHHHDHNHRQLEGTTPDAYLEALCVNITRVQRAEIAWMSLWTFSNFLFWILSYSASRACC